MTKKSTSQSAPAHYSQGEGGFVNLRVLIGSFVFLAGIFLVLLGLGAFSKAAAQANESDQTLPRSGPPTLVPSQSHPVTPWTPGVPLERIPARGAGILLDTVNWTPIGPAPLMTAGSNGNVSGRITGIAADPTDANTIYVSPAGGGVWKTTNGGTSWSMLTDAQRTLSMGGIAIAPSNPNVVYAGTGEANNVLDSNYGRGILVSTDAGTSWTLRTGPADVFNDRRLTGSKIDIHPTDPNTAYAAVADFGTNGLYGSDTGVYKTTDGGINWTNVTSAFGLDMVTSWSDVLIDPTDPTTVYAAHGWPFGDPSNGVYKSTDSGATWTLLANAPKGIHAGRIAIALSRSNHLVLYVTSSTAGNSSWDLFKIERSDDGGATFTDLTAGTPDYMGGQGNYDTTVIVDPTNSAIVYVGGAYGNNTVLRSGDSGVTWSDISNFSSGDVSPHADHHAMTFDANGKLLDGNDGGIYRLDVPIAIPVVWSNLNGNLETIQFQGIGLHPTDPNAVIGGSQDNGTSVFSGALLWVQTDGGDGGFAKFSQTNGNIAYHQIPNGSGGTSFFRVSTNGGLTWVTRTRGIRVDVNNQQFYAPFVVDPGNGDRVLYGTNRIWETTNEGTTWTPICNVGFNGWNPHLDYFVNAIGLAPSDANTIYAATHQNGFGPTDVFVSTDHGTNWTQRNLPVMRPVQDIQVDPARSTIAYAVISAFNEGGNVFKTTNAGATWTSISGNLPSEPVWSLQIDAAAGALYVGADDGVYVTMDGGSTWTRFGAGLPNAQVFQIELNHTLRILGAATHGRGMWEIALASPPTSRPPPTPRPRPTSAPRPKSLAANWNG